MEDHVTWEHAVRRQRQLTEAADAEFRRHPDPPWPRLRTAEPQPRHGPHASTPAEESWETARRIAELAAQHREYGRHLSERQSVAISDHSYEAPAPWSPAWAVAARDAILQQPKPQIQPSAQIPERVADRDADREAHD